MWISATHLKNFLLKDHLVDWLKEYSTRKCVIKQDNKFVSFIMKKGEQFEESIVDYINNNKLPVVTVSTRCDEKSYKKTIKLMKEGCPIIHSAPVKNTKNNTRGIIDLLVRNDYIHKLIDIPPVIEDSIAPKLNGNYHYVIVDIKFSTIPMRSNGVNILNIGR